MEGRNGVRKERGGIEGGRRKGYVRVRGWFLVPQIAYPTKLPYKWLFSRVVYFTNGPSLSISRILISRMAAGDRIFLILVKYFKILYFTN